MDKYLSDGEGVALKVVSRRKVLKTIVGGVTALAAYRVLPAK